MDPLSIATGISGLIDLCLKAGFAIKAAREGSKTVDAKIGLLDGEIRGYTQVLELMNSTLQDPMIASSFQATGHIGGHWRSILALIEDSSDTLDRLNTILRKVDKSVRVMDSTRKHFRLLFAADEIDTYQKTIKTYRDTMQMSVQIIILWNQVSDSQMHVNMAVRLDDLTRFIRDLAMDMNKQIVGLRSLVQEDADRDRAQTLTRMKHCIETAADVVSSASTALGLGDRATVVAPSELGDIFGSRTNDSVMRWMDETFQEREDSSHSSPAAPGDAIPDISTLGINDDDSDGDMELEIELIKAHQNRVQDLLANKRWLEAIPVLERGISRIRKHEKQLNDPKLKSWFQLRLRTGYWKQKSWEKLKDICLEYLEENSPSTEDYDIWQYHLVLRNIAYAYWCLLDRTSAKMYIRRAIKGSLKMGEDGESSLLTSLRFMMRFCEADGESTEEEAYRLMYDELKAKIDNNAGTEQKSSDEPGAGQVPQVDKQANPTVESGIRECLVESPTPPSEFVNVHLVTSDSRDNPSYRGKIFRALDPNDRKMGWWTDATGARLAPMPFEPLTVATLNGPDDNTRLIIWESQSGLQDSEPENSPLFQLPECTIHYQRDISLTSWGTSQIELKRTTRMPLCVLIALKMVKIDNETQFQFEGTYDLIQRYFYDPNYYSIPIILLSLVKKPVSDKVKALDPELPPSSSPRIWMRTEPGSGRATRGYYSFIRSLEDPAGIREVFEFIAGRSWEGKYFGPPESQA